jgi:hypothetical protein
VEDIVLLAFLEGPARRRFKNIALDLPVLEGNAM